MKLPNRPLSRKAVKQFFDKVPSPKWDYWFRHEKDNGLFELRVQGPFDKAYYDGQKVKEWLLAEGHYHPRDFNVMPPLAGWLTPMRRQAVAA